MIKVIKNWHKIYCKILFFSITLVTWFVLSNATYTNQHRDPRKESMQYLISLLRVQILNYVHSIINILIQLIIIFRELVKSLLELKNLVFTVAFIKLLFHNFTAQLIILRFYSLKLLKSNAAIVTKTNIWRKTSITLVLLIQQRTKTRSNKIKIY